VTQAGPRIDEESFPGPADVEAVRVLAAAATDADGVAPLSEAVLLDLAHRGEPGTRHLFARRDSRLIGYAHLDAQRSAELVVHPDFRRRGIGAALVEALEAADPDRMLRVWAHGRLQGAVALAAARGYAEDRVLWQLRRPLDWIPDAPLPDGITLRAFVPGQDEAAWVEVNNRAFAGHPEQSGWTVEDLLVREGEPWFDPTGLLLATRADGSVAGFHWTKVHPEEDPPIGEVYVLAVDPSARGLRLGPALTVAGLRHLRDRGLSQVGLYVDESNAGAVRLYESLGFRKWDADVQFRRSRQR
jgi:mycothiol synthase